MKRALFAVLLVCTTLLLGGCGAGRDIEEYLFPIMMGLDAASDGQLTLTVKALSGHTGSDGADYITLSATGHGYVQALSLLRATIPRTHNLSQLREVVISETLARSQAIAPLLSDILRHDRANGSAALVICAGEARTMLDAQQAYVGTRLSRYIEILLAQYREKGTIPYATVLSAERAFAGDACAPIAIYAAVNAFDTRQPVAETDTLDTLPGHLDRASPNPVEYMGSAVFAAGQMVGTLTGAQTQMLRMLTGDFSVLQYSIDGEVYILRRLWPARRQVQTRSGKQWLQATLFVRAQSLSGVPIEDPQALGASLAKDAQSLLTLLQALGADAAGFGRAQLAGYLTMDAWAASNWSERFAACEAEAEVWVSTGRQ